MKKELLEKIYKNNKNLTITGDILSGKTTKIFFPLLNKIIENNENLLILDPKREYINTYYNKLTQKDYNIIILNLRIPEESDAYNPLTYPHQLYKENKIDQAIEQLELLTEEIFNQKLEKDLFIGLTLTLFKYAKEEEINFMSIQNILNTISLPNKNNTLFRDYYEIKIPPKFIRNYIFNTLYANEHTKEEIITTTKQKINFLTTSPNLAKMLSKSTIDLTNIPNQKTAIFLINKDENSHLNPLPAIFLKQLYSSLIETTFSKRFNFILDNFDSLNTNTINITNLENILASANSRNIKFYLGTKCLSLLNKKYNFYLETVSNLIEIKQEKTKLKLDNLKEEIELNDIYIPSKENIKINYPTLEINKIPTFSLTNAVIEELNKLKNQLTEIQETPTKLKDSVINDFIRKINLKIQEIKDLNTPEYLISIENQKLPPLPPQTNSTGPIDDLINQIDASIEKLEKESPKIYE